MATKPSIVDVYPKVGISGGEITILCKNLSILSFNDCQVYVGSTQCRLVSASNQRIIAEIPQIENKEDLSAGLTLHSKGKTSSVMPFMVAELLADNLHPVANPAYDADSDSIYTTTSGQRGKKNTETSVWRISSNGKATKFVTDIMNPTGLAFSLDGTLFITSRYDGNIYAVSPFGDISIFAQDLGVVTGIAFDKNGVMFVGDRQGVIYKIDEHGNEHKFASLEPSIAAFHLAFSPDDNLYITGPTTAGTRETVYKVSSTGQVTDFFSGLGRPQGLAFDINGYMYVAASMNSHRGIIKISPSGEAENLLAGNNLIGLAFDDKQNLLLATMQEIYRIPLGIEGYINYLLGQF